MLRTTIGNIPIETCIYNASGPRCTTFTELKSLIDCPYTGAFISKSCTLNYRIGNEEPRYYENRFCSINSTGLANLGYKEYIRFGEEYEYHKPYFISVSGLSLEDNLKIIDEIQNCDKINGIELNLSCPNVIGKPQIGYDFDAIDNTLRNVFEIYDNQKQIFGIKLPPYFDLIHYGIVSDIIKDYKINFLTCINSLGNGLIVDSVEEKPVIKPKGGYGGIGGSIIKPIALANVNQFYKLLGDRVDIVGCGGIYSGMDAFEHILCGAKAIQIGTKFMMDGEECFGEIGCELMDIMEGKGYKSVEDFRGKLNINM